MSKNKTTENNAPVLEFLNSIEDNQKKQDALMLFELFGKLTGKEAKMWGNSIVGYGNYHYKYDSGREGDFFKAGFSPRKSNFSIYIMSGFPELQDMLKALGKHKMGKSCLYIKRLSDIDMEIFKEIIRKSMENMNLKYPED